MILPPQDLLIIGELAALTFLIGLLIGFIGAGGAGIAVAILTTVFSLPVHTAIGTAIAAMFFVTISGAISHFQEGNVAQRSGLVVGLSGAAGAVLGADTSQAVSEQTLGIRGRPRALGSCRLGLVAHPNHECRSSATGAVLARRTGQRRAGMGDRHRAGGIRRSRSGLPRCRHGAVPTAWSPDPPSSSPAPDGWHDYVGAGLYQRGRGRGHGATWRRFGPTPRRLDDRFGVGSVRRGALHEACSTAPVARRRRLSPDCCWIDVVISVTDPG